MKTPTPRVLAALLVLRALDGIASVPAEEIAEIGRTRVSVEKRKKVMDQVQKIARTLKARVDNIVTKFRASAADAADEE